MIGSRCPYPRQLPAPDLAAGTTVKVIGLGGVGSIVARYLAVYLAALDRPLRLVLIDGDAFEESNGARMLFSYAGNKAAVVREELLERLLGTRLTIEVVPEFVTPANCASIVQERDVVLACVDNHATRRLLSLRCEALSDVTLISGGNDAVGPDEEGRTQRGTLGSVQVFLRRDGVDAAPPLTHHHPEIAEPQDRRPDEISCTEALASQPQMLFTNLMTASCMLNTFLLHACPGALHYSDLSFDTADGLMRPVTALAGVPPANP